MTVWDEPAEIVHKLLHPPAPEELPDPDEPAMTNEAVAAAMERLRRGEPLQVKP